MLALDCAEAACPYDMDERARVKSRIPERSAQKASGGVAPVGWHVKEHENGDGNAIVATDGPCGGNFS